MFSQADRLKIRQIFDWFTGYITCEQKMISLDCQHCELTSLKISNNQKLTTLNCGLNRLSVLDISNNTTLMHLIINGMPTLEEVCVWTLPFPGPSPYNVNVDTTGSPNVYFTLECSQ